MIGTTLFYYLLTKNLLNDEKTLYAFLIVNPYQLPFLVEFEFKVV